MSFLTLYRIGDSRHDLFDGTGAMLYGGRWNTQGHSVIYTACSFAGAMLEMLVRVGRANIPETHKYIKIDVSQKIKIEVSTEKININTIDEKKSKEYGDQWIIEKRSALLFVPSVVAPEEQNVLINTSHPDFKYIKPSDPKPIKWDHRLFGQ